MLLFYINNNNYYYYLLLLLKLGAGSPMMTVTMKAERYWYLVIKLEFNFYSKNQLMKCLSEHDYKYLLIINQIVFIQQNINILF